MRAQLAGLPGRTVYSVRMKTSAVMSSGTKGSQVNSPTLFKMDPLIAWALDEDSLPNRSFTRPTPNSSSSALSALHLPSTTPRETSRRAAPFSMPMVGASQVAWEKSPSGKPVGAEFDDAGTVAQRSGRMAGVGVAESAKFLVVAAEECWTRVHPRGGSHQSAIELQTEGDHGVGFVDVGPRKEFSSGSTKDILRSSEDALIGLAAARNVEQAEQNPFRAHSQRIVEISGATRLP